MTPQRKYYLLNKDKVKARVYAKRNLRNATSTIETGAVEVETGAVEVETGAVEVETGAVEVETGAVEVETETTNRETETVEVETATTTHPQLTPTIAPEHYIALLLKHNKHLKRVLRRFIPISKDKTDSRSNYEAVMTEYTDLSVNYFKYKDTRILLTIGERYVSEAIDDDGMSEPIFFTIVSKSKHGINVSICES
jgi:hypothetical protein